MKRKFGFLTPFLSLTLILLTGACGSSGNDGVHTTPPAFSISGNWVFDLLTRGVGNPKPQTGFLLAKQNTVTGELSVVSNTCLGSGTVSGSVSGTDVSLSVSATGVNIDLTGTLGSDKASMSGTYTTLAQGCGRSESGTWTAALLPTLNASFDATTTPPSILLSSNRKIIKEVGGTDTTFPFSISGQIMQGANAGAITAPLTGTLSVVGHPCFNASATPSTDPVTFSGVITGTQVTLNLLASDGSQVGQIVNATFNYAPTDGSPMNITGQYSLSTQGVAGDPCFSGDKGTVTLTLGAGA